MGSFKQPKIENLLNPWLGIKLIRDPSQELLRDTKGFLTWPAKDIGNDFADLASGHKNVILNAVNHPKQFFNPISNNPAGAVSFLKETALANLLRQAKMGSAPFRGHATLNSLAVGDPKGHGQFGEHENRLRRFFGPSPIVSQIFR